MVAEKKSVKKPRTATKINYVVLNKPEKVSAFHVKDSDGHEFTEKSLLKHWTVLYFYPKDMTSGCTVEAQDFQKNLKKFKSIGVEVIGVSRDSCTSHLKFAGKENLLFTLLSDEKEDLCKVFDVLKEKSLYGRKYIGIDRSTFLISPKGEIVLKWTNVKVTGHVEEVLKVIKDQIA